MPTTTCPICSTPSTQQCSHCKNPKYFAPPPANANTTPPTNSSATHSHNSTALPTPNLRRCISFLPNDASPPRLWLAVQDFSLTMETRDSSTSFTACKWGNDVDTILSRGEKKFLVNLRTMATESLERHALDAATKDKTGSEWRGPLVALCGRVNEVYDVVEVKDMDMRDSSALAEFLRRRGGDLDTYGMWEAYRGLTGAPTDADGPEAAAEGRRALEQFQTVKI